MGENPASYNLTSTSESLVALYPGPALESSSKPPIHKNKDISTSPEDKEVQCDNSSDEKKGDPINVPKEESRDNRVPEGKSSSKKAEDVDLVVAAPISSANKSSSLEGKEYKNSTISAGNQACNYAIGKWVEDDSRPFYSGFECKQWLSPMWACRLTQRTDFAYEKFQWRPKNCKMDKFTGSNFLRSYDHLKLGFLEFISHIQIVSKLQPGRSTPEPSSPVSSDEGLGRACGRWEVGGERFQDKTLAFIGDSLGRQQFQSLMCMITGGKESPDVTSVGWKYGLVKARGALRPDGWAYWFPGTNTTILYYWSASLCDLEPLNSANPTMDYAMHLDRPPAFLRRFLKKFDVLVLNTGHHWNRGKLKANRWVMHVGGVPNTDTKIAEIGGAKNLTIHSIVKWVDSQLPKYPGLKAFYRTISPRHFFNGTGTQEGAVTTPPLSSSQLRDEVIYLGIASEPHQECRIACTGVYPGIPDMWNEILFAQL
ncbi:Protein trichome birefringence-like 16 [Vitis vinifera]|uniref:Protein trichome birefringence-like 16 n=1 Tax=Vitis vinifera TaxID=29760 RepID=A0A438J9B0_VITVI|nr:Protein trichome birefringence-like 16 [Vitis vinifera]